MKRLALHACGLAALALAGCNNGSATISRERAGQLVVDQLVDANDPTIVFSHPEPVTPDSALLVGSPTRMGERTAIAIESNAWLFWIDDEPGARFDHATRFVLVDRNSGEITVHDANWWPILDGTPLWIDTAEYWDDDNWVWGSESPRRGSLALPEPSLEGACQPGFGTALVYNGWEEDESGEESFAFDAANMGQTLEGLGFTVTHGSTAGAGAGEISKNGLDAWFTQKAKELGPGDNLVIYITGHGSQVSEMFAGTLGHGDAGGIYSGVLAQQLARFDPGVEIIVIVDTCASEAMLGDLQCVADLGLSAARSDQPSFGDLDLAFLELFGGADPDVDDEGGEFTSALARSMRELVEDPDEFARLETVAQEGGGSFMSTLVAESTIRQRMYNLAEIRGLADAQLRMGAAKTRPVAADPTPPQCTGDPGGSSSSSTDGTTDTDGTTGDTDGTTGDTDPTGGCADPDLEHIAQALAAALGTDVDEPVCSGGQSLPAGNQTLHPDGIKTSDATEEVDWISGGSILGVDLPSDVPCGPGAGYTVLCTGMSLPIDGPAAIFYGRVAAPIDIDEPDFSYQYAFVFDTDGDPSNDYVPGPQYPADFFAGSDLWLYTLHNAGEGWYTWGASAAVGFANVPSSERILIADDVVALIVDQDEIGGDAASWRMTAFRHLGDGGAAMPWSGDVVPPVGDPLTPLP
ncbi:MAG: caspase family protein [Nannocystaceae bacterium]|nr:caspase family protein [Nannocystaceae bacterium]